MSKSQFIMDFPKSDVNLLERQRQEFRILPYSAYSSDRVILGMEEKDVKDVCAIFLDHSIGEGREEIDGQKMRKILRKDKKLALTVTLNLQNLTKRTAMLEKWVTSSEAGVIVDRIQGLLNILPEVENKWDKPWWNTAVETPMIE